MPPHSRPPLSRAATLKFVCRSLALLVCASASPAQAAPPLRTHPGNPHIFDFRGEPTILLTLGEHYGSAIHPDFDYLPYLDKLRNEGQNLTRVVLLGFRLHTKPDQSPFAPPAARFLQPWERAAGQGNAIDGEGKWDFNTWNEDYFSRLRNFIQACSDRGIVVELTLFNTIYGDTPDFWNNSPFNPSNNVQGYGPGSQYDVVRGTDANLTSVQEAAVRRIVRELNVYDNIYYEIQNEPFWNQPGTGDSAEAAFHNTILGFIRDEESSLPYQHLVAHNYPTQLANLSNDFDVINGHYPFTVPGAPWVVGGENLLDTEYNRDQPLALDESSAYDDLTARLEAWMFVLGGGAVYNGLDSNVFQPNAYLIYSLANPAGDVEPGISIRTALRNLAVYARNLALTDLGRDGSWVTGGLPSGASLQAMSSPGQQYVAYLHHGTTPTANFSTVYSPIDTSNHAVSLQVTLDAGDWQAVWTRPEDLSVVHSETFTHAGGPRVLQSVNYQADVALRIDRTGVGDTTAPPPPRGVSATAPTGGSVTLSWQPVSADDLSGYQIYHSTDPGIELLPANRIASLGSSQTSFLHGSVTMDQPHYYVVTSVDQAGNESFASREILSTVASRPFTGSPSLVPGTVECENFDTGGQGIAYNDLTTTNSGLIYRTSEDVDLQVTSDSSGIYQVEDTNDGEWMDYTIAVRKTGHYDFSVRCSNTEPGGQFRFSLDGELLGDELEVPNGSWQNVHADTIPLNQGTHILRLQITAAGPSGSAGAFNSITITPSPKSGPTALAGDDQAVTDADWNQLESVTLNASQCIAGDNPIVSYAWLEHGNPIASGVNPTINLPPGVHRIELQATDSAGWTDTDEVIATVHSLGFVNGSFEPGFGAWSTGGNVSLSTGFAATQGAQVALFNESNSTPNGFLIQSFPTVPGQAYRLQFDMGVKAFNTSQQALEVLVQGDATLFYTTHTLNGVANGSVVWSPRSGNFVADSGLTSVRFRDVSAVTNSIDLLLDHVRITRVLDDGNLPETPSIASVPGGWRISLSTPDVGLYQLQRSPDLQNWTTLQQQQLDTPGPLDFTDTTATGERVFYRVGLQQSP